MADKTMNVVRIFTAPLEFPCGPGTTCCSIGQSEETVKALVVSAMEGLGVSVKVHNVEEDGGVFPGSRPRGNC